MATWEELTAEQQNVYQTFERDLRHKMGVFQKLLNGFESLDTTYSAQVLGILATLDDNTIVPNSGGLSGSVALDSDAEMVALVSHLQGVLTSYNTTSHKSLRDKAAGLPNTNGSF